jgi:hypothetical protein
MNTWGTLAITGTWQSRTFRLDSPKWEEDQELTVILNSLFSVTLVSMGYTLLVHR